MATGQSLLDRMELLNQELQLQSGEEDVTRGLLALNIAQDTFESRAALRPSIYGSTTPVGTVTTSASTETTAFPTGVLRIDRLQFIDPDTSRPAWDLVKIRRVGSHAWNRYWPINIVSTSSSGRPRAYWTNRINIYWDPLPSGTHTVRYYGFTPAADITAGGTFAYEDIVMLPLASFAVSIMSLGLGDSITDTMRLAEATFDPVLDSLSSFDRDGAIGLEYERTHST